MATLYLLLGANLEDPKKQLAAAVQAIQEQIGTIVQQSSIYITESWGTEEKQPDYLNQVLAVQSEWSAQEVLQKTQRIEEKLGRVRHKKWEARVIDIDILFYEDAIIDLPNLKIPHPLFQERNFAMVPMNEIAPNYIHPVFNKNITELLRESSDDLAVKLIYLH
jgi:2-amino-4-hydroxy-6-hydroxymethyldihydropteridine diphosphokinase